MATRSVTVNLIANIGNYVSGMTRAAGATGGLNTKVLAVTGILGGVVAGFGSAVSKSAEFEKAMSGIQAATGATGAELDKLRQAAMDAGADTQYSATEAAAAITEMSKAGVDSADIMSGGLSGALNLAAAGQLEVATAAEIASVAMTQFNLTGEDLPHVADLLAAGAGKAMGSVEDMGQALNQAGLVASAAGLSIEETTGGLAAFASAGLVGSDAGTSFKTMLQAIQAPSGKTAELMAELGINMYDTNGNMLGLSEMAGVLQDKLGHLSQEQRNAAMAQIFGSDAVRAANVLYKEGASGITEWIGAVNDTGYAQEQAAMLTDNLKGDLERLGGAWDTLMIGLGEGSQGPLRWVVQALTGVIDAISPVLSGIGSLVEWFTELPGPVLAGVGVMTALMLINGPLSNAIGMSALALNAWYSRAVAAGGGAGLAAAAMTGLRTAAAGTMALMGGPLGLAIVGLTVGVGFLTSAFSDTKDATVDVEGAQRGLTDALRESEGALDDNVRAAAAKAAEDAGLLKVSEDAGISLAVMTDAVLGNKDAYDEVTAALAAYQTAQTQMVMTENGPMMVLNDQAEAAKGAKASLDVLAPTVEQTAAEQARLAAATDTSSSAMAGAEEQTASFEDQMKAAEDAVKSSKDAVDLFKLSLDILTGASVSMIQVESAFQSALAAAEGAMDGLNGSVLDGTGHLNLQSEAGRQAADVLLGVRDSGNELIATMLEQGATEDEVRAKDAFLRQSFIETAGQLGINRQRAEELANQILGIPGERETTITANTTQAVSEIEALRARIQSAGGYTTIVTGGGVQGGRSGQGRATGAVVEYYAQGGLRPMRADIADVVPANSWRVIGDRPVGDEAFIPLNNSARSQAILAEAAARMGYGLAPADLRYLADGGVLENGYTWHVGLGAGQLADMERSLTAAGAGALGGAWGSIWQVVKAAIPQARMNSTYRPGDPGYHGRGKAIDFGFGTGPGGAGSAGLASIARFLYRGYGKTLAELIYDGIGDDTPDVKNGRDHTYNAATRAQHANHVHAAVYDSGGILAHGTAALNLSGSPERVLSPRETAAFDALMSREFPGGGGPGGAAVVSTTDARSYPITVTSGPDVAAIVRAVRDSQRDTEFLHG